MELVLLAGLVRVVPLNEIHARRIISRCGSTFPVSVANVPIFAPQLVLVPAPLLPLLCFFTAPLNQLITVSCQVTRRAQTFPVGIPQMSEASLNRIENLEG